MSTPIHDHEHPTSHDHVRISSLIRRRVQLGLEEEVSIRRLTKIASDIIALESQIEKSPDKDFIREKVSSGIDDALRTPVV